MKKPLEWRHQIQITALSLTSKMTRGQLFGPLVNSIQSFITMSQNYCPGIFLLQKKATYLISVESKFQLLTKHQFQTLLLSLLYSVTALTSKKKGELRKSCEQCTDTVKTTFKFIFPLHITFPLWLLFISLIFFFFTEKAWLTNSYFVTLIPSQFHLLKGGGPELTAKDLDTGKWEQLRPLL